MNIFQALRESHDKQRTLLDLLVETSGDSEGRRDLYAKVKAELDDHAIAEERHFYVPLMEIDLTQEKSRHSVAEHHEMDELLEELDTADMSSPAWLATAKTLREKVIHHLDEEEQEVFQMAGKALTDAQKTDLAKDYMTHMDTLAAER